MNLETAKSTLAAFFAGPLAKAANDYDIDVENFDFTYQVCSILDEWACDRKYENEDSQFEPDEVIPGLEIVDQHGGEGEGDGYWFVYKLTTSEGDVGYIRFSGWHNSWEGVEFHTVSMVEPEERMVTFYEKRIESQDIL